MSAQRPAPSDSRPPAYGGMPRGPGDRGPRKSLNRAVVVVAFVVFLAVVVAAVIGGMRLVEGRATPSTTEPPRGATVSVDINPGMNATEIGALLEEEGVINSSAEFVDVVKARGSEDDLQPGIYQLTQGQELVSVVEQLERGTGSASFKVTIPEGLAASQTAALLAKDGVMDGESYAELAQQPQKFVVPKVGGSEVAVDTLEGLLFPSTYYLLKGDGPTELIGAQLAAFDSKTQSLPWSRAKDLGLTTYEIVIVASLIEKEASIADERAKVAAVIYNRLKKDMSLGIDATVRYALGKWTGALTAKDLEVDSPFNTRVNKGLPPSPIASPGVAALKAALNPADVNYLYYVLSDVDGHHFFTDSYDEFLEAKEQSPVQ